MARGKAIVLAAGLALAAFGGCGQQNLLREGDRADTRSLLQLPPRSEADAQAASMPVDVSAREPATVANPEREPRYLSLMEAIALALQQGRVGVQNVRVPGLPGDDLVSFVGAGVFGSDSIRVLALGPAVVGAEIERQRSRFDALWTTSLAWANVDEPTQGLSPLYNGQAGLFSSTLAKPLPTGGVAGITFGTDYHDLSKPPTALFPVLNPSYTSRVQVGFEQPLLRGYGVEVNQLLPGTAGSGLFPGLNARAPGGEGILIARVRSEQQRAEFDRALNYLLLNVEAAYWHLYGAYVGLYSADEALRLGHEAWRLGKAAYDEGTIDLADFAPTRVQYERFRGDRVQALGRVLEAERALRQLLGLAVEDGRRLVPADAPTLAPYQPDWGGAVQDALTRRPELILAREELKVRQFKLAAQRNGLLPDLRVQATYAAVGLGTRLDGNGTYVDPNGLVHPDNSLRGLASNHFNDWTMGLTLNMPLGFRLEHAAIRQAKLLLAQSYGILKEQETRAQNSLARQYRQVLESHKVIEARRQERQALAWQMRARLHKFAQGKLTVDFLLQTQRQWADALNLEYQAIVEYNVALAGFEFAKGTIQQYDSVVIADGPLPAAAQVQAVAHERERTRAHVLRQREGHCSDASPQGVAPPAPTEEAPLSLPAVLANAPPTQAPPLKIGSEDELPTHLPRVAPRESSGPFARPPRAQLLFEIPRQGSPRGAATGWPAEDRRTAAPLSLPGQQASRPASLPPAARPNAPLGVAKLSAPKPADPPAADRGDAAQVKMPVLTVPTPVVSPPAARPSAAPVSVAKLPAPKPVAAPAPLDCRGAAAVKALLLPMPKLAEDRRNAERVTIPTLPAAKLAAPLAYPEIRSGAVPELASPRLGAPLTGAEWKQYVP